MDKKVLLRLLNHRIEEIETTLNFFSKPGSVHDIELDMLLSKIRFFYSEVKLLSQIDEEEEKTEDIQSAPAVSESPVAQKPPTITEPSTTADPKQEEIPEESESSHEPENTPELPPADEPSSGPETSLPLETE